MVRNKECSDASAIGNLAPSLSITNYDMRGQRWALLPEYSEPEHKSGEDINARSHGSIRKRSLNFQARSLIMAKKCVHKGCGKTYENEDEECVYHPGPPVFHVGQKGMYHIQEAVSRYSDVDMY